MVQKNKIVLGNKLKNVQAREDIISLKGNYRREINNYLRQNSQGSYMAYYRFRLIPIVRNSVPLAIYLSFFIYFFYFFNSLMST